jgi:hypothetical protein
VIQAHLAQYFPLGMTDKDRPVTPPGRLAIGLLARAIARLGECPRAVCCSPS